MKIVENGKVAVAVSYGFGAGWSTWNSVSPFDAQFNQLFLEGRHEEAVLLADRHGHVSDGIFDIEIVWVPEGTEFFIREDDGAESIHFKQDIPWQVA